MAEKTNTAQKTQQQNEGFNANTFIAVSLLFLMLLGVLLALRSGEDNQQDESIPKVNSEVSLDSAELENGQPENSDEVLSDASTSNGQESLDVLNLDGTPQTGDNSKDMPVNTDQPTDTPKTYPAPPENTLTEGADYRATIKTNKGDITVDLFESAVPQTVNNFVFLAREGFYNGTRSHRIIKDFMIQMGDPLTVDPSLKDLWGSGDPGYKFADEPFEGEYSRGILAMANSGPDTNGSQFFIMHKDFPLSPNYVIFGKVVDDASLAVVDAVAETPVTESRSGEVSSPAEEVVINEVTILEQ